MWVFSKDRRLALNTASGVVLEIHLFDVWYVRSYHLSSPDRRVTLGSFEDEPLAVAFWREKLREAGAVEDEG